jgi:DNA-binding transcriptional regulator/RsmH inhibitor MraZ
VVDSCFYRGPDASFPLNMNVFNMLNARYIVANGQLPPDKFTLVNADEARKKLTYENPGALPRAWFVGATSIVQNSDDALHMMNTREFNPSQTAILEKPLTTKVDAQGLTVEKAGVSIGMPDSAWSVSIAEYKSREIKLQTKTAAAGLLVLSEIYYPAGWNAYVDGSPTEIYRTNYILRSVVVPTGAHEVVFKFEPKMYELGYTLSNAGWGVALLCILFGLWKMPAVRERLSGTKGK